MNFSGRILSQSEFVASATQEDSIGAMARTADGRKFRYVKAGAADLVPGNLVQAPAQVTTLHNLTVNTALNVAGSRVIQGVSPQSAITAGQYSGGTMLVSNGASVGFAATIAGHGAGNSSVNCSVTLVASDVFPTSANSTTRVDLIQNPYKGVIQGPTTPTSVIVGSAVYAIPNTQFGYVQTGGLAPVLIEGTPAIGVAVSPSANVAGAAAVASLAAQAANTATTAAIVGFMAQTGVDARVKLVKLVID